MKCLLKYQWVKLPRNQMPVGKGVMGAWARLASRAAFRNGQARYCSYINQVTAGSWAGGIVGLKSILGIKNRKKALETMDRLVQLGYIEYELDPKTKKLTYQIKDWVVQCSGEPCMGAEAVYATPGYGFLCLPRDITQRLAEAHYHFDESDAWLDLWCHSVWQDVNNAFSHIAPAVQFGKYGAVLTLEALGRRWGWEKTKVWRFFKKHADAFPLYKLPGSFGCLIFNTAYPAGQSFALPSPDHIIRIIEKIRIYGNNAHFATLNDHQRYSLDGTTYQKYEAWTEYDMPSAMHELSSDVIRFRKPANSTAMPANLEDWAEKFAASEGAKRLQKYCTDAGLILNSDQKLYFSTTVKTKILLAKQDYAILIACLKLKLLV